MEKTELFFKEHYYTASRQQKGFHTIDSTEGLNKEEIQELEKKGEYSPAIKLPKEPSNDEIEALFPVNLAFFQLKSSGRFVYLHSKYIGKAYDAVTRFGNYFSHSMILREGFPIMPAKMIFEDIAFKDSYSIEESTTYNPELKEDRKEVFEISDFVLETLFRKFQTSFKSKPTSLSVLSKVFDLIVDGKISKPGYNITICDKKENLEVIILSVNYFLPTLLANKISFATYVDDPTKRNYPFAITGIIPECGIDKLPEQYFIFLDSNLYTSYTPINLYSKYIAQIITDGNFAQWQNLLKELNEFGIAELNQKLNLPAIFLEFKKNIQANVTIEDLKTLLPQLPDSKNKELKEFVLSENPELYLHYVLNELSKIANDPNASITKKCDLFLNLYNQHFLNSSPLSQNLLLQFVEEFRNKFSGLEKSKISLFILGNLNCTELSNLEEIIGDADLYFGEESVHLEERLRMISPLNKYITKGISKDKISNIMGNKKLDDFIKLSQTGKLFKDWKNYKNDIINLKERERKSILKACFNPTFVKGKFDFDFRNHILIVDTLYTEGAGKFWKDFFEDNPHYNSDNSIKLYSKDYLKKKFISSIFLKQLDRFDLIEDLRPADEIMDWLEEDIRENTTEIAVLQTFLEAYPNNELAKKPVWKRIFG